jgi:hypothetical protein
MGGRTVAPSVFWRPHYCFIGLHLSQTWSRQPRIEAGPARSLLRAGPCCGPLTAARRKAESDELFCASACTLGSKRVVQGQGCVGFVLRWHRWLAEFWYIDDASEQRAEQVVGMGDTAVAAPFKVHNVGLLRSALAPTRISLHDESSSRWPWPDARAIPSCGGLREHTSRGTAGSS